MRARGARAGPRLIARVQPLVTARSVDRTFDYGVPEGVELESGSRVLVPLGARQVDGVVVAVAEGDDDELKPIDEVIGRVPPALLDLAVWMADEYGSTLARALALVIPPRPPKRALKARDDFPDPDVAVVRRLTDAQRAAVAGCVEAAAAGEREVLLHGVTGSGKTEVYLRGDRARAGAGQRRRSCWCPRSRSRRRRPAGSSPGSATPSRCCTAR